MNSLCLLLFNNENIALYFLNLGPIQRITEILLYTKHTDPQLQGTTALLIGHFVRAILIQEPENIDAFLANCEYSYFQHFQKNLM